MAIVYEEVEAVKVEVVGDSITERLADKLTVLAIDNDCCCDVGTVAKEVVLDVVKKLEKNADAGWVAIYVEERAIEFDVAMADAGVDVGELEDAEDDKVVKLLAVLPDQEMIEEGAPAVKELDVAEDMIGIIEVTVEVVAVVADGPVIDETVLIPEKVLVAKAEDETVTAVVDETAELVMGMVSISVALEGDTLLLVLIRVATLDNCVVEISGDEVLEKSSTFAVLESKLLGSTVLVELMVVEIDTQGSDTWQIMLATCEE